jgi:Uma2 family endonuclease
MNLALRQPLMTRDQFLDWVQAQEGRHEFDGFQPIAMTGGTINHSRCFRNIHVALSSRLRNTGCEALGPDAGLATIGNAVRYPDALVTCAKFPGTALLVPGVVVVFEVLSPTSGRTDRIDKLREYRAVPSIRRYVILEHLSAALMVFSRNDSVADWTAIALTADDILEMPEISISIPVSEFYEGVDLPDTLTLAEA